MLHLRPVGSTVELPSFPLEMTRDHIGFDASAMRFLLGNVAAETARAQEADDLAPLINNLVELLDQALSQYYALSAEKAALATADMLNPAALTGQVQTLVESIQRNYALHLDDTEHPVVSIVIPVYNKFDLTYQCIRSIQQHGAEIELGGRLARGVLGYRQLCVELDAAFVERLEDQIERHHLGERGRVGQHVGVLLAQHLSGLRIEQDPLEDRPIFTARRDQLVTVARHCRQCLFEASNEKEFQGRRPNPGRSERNSGKSGRAPLQ